MAPCGLSPVSRPRLRGNLSGPLGLSAVATAARSPRPARPPRIRSVVCPLHAGTDSNRQSRCNRLKVMTAAVATYVRTRVDLTNLGGD
jgi:hypothetical protein